eukprot:754329-Hanusia_phi.AAC.2
MVAVMEMAMVVDDDDGDDDGDDDDDDGDEEEEDRNEEAMMMMMMTMTVTVMMMVVLVEIMKMIVVFLPSLFFQIGCNPSRHDDSCCTFLHSSTSQPVHPREQDENHRQGLNTPRALFSDRVPCSWSRKN